MVRRLERDLPDLLSFFSLPPHLWKKLRTTNVIERDLLDQVDGLSFRYLDAGYNWDTTWPPPTLGSANATVTLAQMRQRPIAVEITLQLHDWGTLVCIVEIPG